VDITIVLIVIVVILALFLVTTYNRLVTLRQRVKEAWSDIDIQLKRPTLEDVFIELTGKKLRE